VPPPAPLPMMMTSYLCAIDLLPYSPGLLCIMPPSVNTVVAVM